MDAGRLSLTLRRIGEEDVYKEGRLTSKSFVAVAPAAKPNRWKTPSPAVKLTPPVPKNEIANITIIRGDDRDEVSVVMEGDGAPLSGGALDASSELAGG